MKSATALSAKWFWSGVGLLLITTILVYSSALRGPQIFDDHDTIQYNPTITQFVTALNPPTQTPVAGRPIVNLSFAFNYWLNAALGVDQSPDPGGVSKTISYHVINLLVHLACGMLLLGIVRRTLRSGRFGDRWAQQADLFSLTVAAIWLLHPLQTEAVDYLTQRTELLVSVCYLATLYFAIRGWRIAAVVACALGMGSKEVMISAPLMVILYDRAFRVTSWRAMLAPDWKARRTLYAALIASMLILIGLMLGNPRGESVGFHTGVPWYEYLHTQGWGIAHYLQLAMLPTGLSLDYDYRPVAHWHGVPGLVLLAALGAGTLFAWTRANRWGWLGFLGTWFFFILAPSSSFVPVLIELVAERRFYLPLAAVIVAIMVVVDALSLRVPAAIRHRLLPSFAVGTVVVLGLLTFHRSALYANPEAIWINATENMPTDPRAWNNLGAVYANASPAEMEKAEQAYRMAIELDPEYVDALRNVAISAMMHQRFDEAETMLRRAIRANPGRIDLIRFLGGMLLDQGKADLAEPMLLQAVQQLPYSGVDQGTLSLAYALEGKASLAVEAAGLATQFGGDDERAWFFAGHAMVLIHQAELAHKYLSRALELDPTDAGARADLASLH